MTKEIKRQECIVYSRVVGWLTPLTRWNNGKKAEWNDRKTFVVKDL
jgi:anaerobic ribonucleoside-triphosphate reductase